MEETNIDSFCRLCLNNSFLRYNIFSASSTDGSPTYQIINNAYDLQISANDGLPEYICENCYAFVKVFQVYKTTAHKARSEIIRLKQDMVKSCGRGSLKVAVMGVENSRQVKEYAEPKVEYDEVENEPGALVCQQMFVEEEKYIGEEGDSSGDNFADQEEAKNMDVGVQDCEALLETESAEAEGLKSSCIKIELYPNEEHFEKELLGEPQSVFECTSCSKRFKSRNSLRSHARTHMAVKRYGCNVCWKRFSRKDTLTSHLVTHTNDRPYECHLCEKRYTFKRALRRHLKVHLHSSAAPNT